MPKPATELLQSPIEYLKGVGPARGELLRKELGVHSFEDLLYHYPFRYIDRTAFHRIGELNEQSDTVQIKGTLSRLDSLGEGPKKRLVGRLRDQTGSIELVWFKGVRLLERLLEVGTEYIAYGKVTAFNGRLNIAHPDMEPATEAKQQAESHFAPVYPSTEKLNAKGLDAKGLRRLLHNLLELLPDAALPEVLPDYVRQKMHLPRRAEALRHIHFPSDEAQLQQARNALKFEELFFVQLRLRQMRQHRLDTVRGHIFGQIGPVFNDFYQNRLPFALTEAQKRVLREIRRDMATGKQMNRLLQGDVGSGKTIVGLMAMLMAIDNGFQACLMAPTEILAQQHFQAIGDYLAGTGLRAAFLSGSVKGKARKQVLALLAEGQIHILVGTHALIEDWVQFKNLGLAITDEQHRFGVEQRAKLWRKSQPHPPHVLVMTATPIPRTLAMTLYGDLDVSVIDELPPGRKPIQTLHKTESGRLRVLGFMREEIAKGRQVYVVYPMIEESETMDLANLQAGYEALAREFPPPQYQISIVHGKMKPADKDAEMQRFVSGQTQIMVATTVIEVGVNVPNASVMVIENTERFGLSQLHQLRGRVGRGAEQSYCILMSGYKLSEEGRQRIATMVRTNNGFEIAEADLKLRGPGNIEGTQQSGMVQFRIADLAKDGRILQVARELAARIIDDDPRLERPEHAPIQLYLAQQAQQQRSWGRIS